MLYNMHRRLIEMKFGCTEPFGGVGILLVGDLMQLKPVKQREIFQRPIEPKNEALFDSEDNIWNLFETVVLKVNKRQGEDNPWTDCLNRIRTITNGELLPLEDIELLISRQSCNFPNKDFDNCAHVYFRNEDVDVHNYKKLYELPHRQHSIYAELSGGPEGYVPTISKNGLVDDSNFRNILDIKIGAKVMIIFNINIMDSLVNGQIGYIIDIISTSKF